MAVFLEVHELGADTADAFLDEWTAPVDDRIHCVKSWTRGDRIALLVEAPDDYRFRARGPRLRELTELFAPRSRWAACEAIDFQ